MQINQTLHNQQQSQNSNGQKQSRYLNNNAGGHYHKDSLLKNYNNTINNNNYNPGGGNINNQQQQQQSSLSKSTLQTLEKLRNSSPNGSANNTNKSGGANGSTTNKKYSLSQTMQQIQQQQQNKRNQHQAVQQQLYHQHQHHLNQNLQANTQLSSSSQLQISNLQHSENAQMNVSIDNLSTLRSSEVNEREKNLLEKIKYYKKENSKLITLMRESENSIIERISKQKKETEQILKILNKLWPLMVRLMQMDYKSIDQTTREVLITLGEMLGKDVNQIQTSINEGSKQFTDSANENKILTREIEFLKKEIFKQKIEVERNRRLGNFHLIKSEFVMKEMMKLVEYQEKQTETYQYQVFCVMDDNEEINSISKLQFLEDQVTEFLGFDDIDYSSKVSQILDKMSLLEKEYIQQIELDISTKVLSLTRDISSIGQSPTQKQELFDTEITLSNSGNNYLIKNKNATQQQRKPSNDQFINIAQFNPNEQVIPQFSLLKQSQLSQMTRKDQPKYVNNSILGKSAPNLNMSVSNPTGTDNISLPDISSTEIAPNKMSAPNKIINFNHARGLHAYQKQLGREQNVLHTQGYIEELGGSPLDMNGIIINDGNQLKLGAQISLKNNMNVLRNRSTSPTIIPKKNLVRKDFV
ncbi:UNKNOWN [Stylonychia lemnae]|uniref:Uncharacterized protein n=1 Tax=Stylonychia lemnae TaxID=5949 RepID=A0A077ZNG9_STYLE|nr:UNKNOWN [Stylonychia lemnae]|eukprot:CDW71522.1 UNKNOWN [Stylonychia lemnae]